MFYGSSCLGLCVCIKMQLDRPDVCDTLMAGTHVKPPAAYPLRVQNVVATMWAGVQLNLVHVSTVMRGRLDKRVFPASIHHMALPTCTPSVFSNGCHLIVGTRHVSDALLAAHLVLHKYESKLKIFPKFHNFQVCNVVCSASLGHFLDIVSFWRDHRHRCVYTPDSFEGVHFYFIRDPFSHKRATVFVLFRSGKFVITGGTSREQLLEYFREMLPVLRQYRCDRPPDPPKHGGDRWEKKDKRLKQHLEFVREHVGIVPGPQLDAEDEEEEDTAKEEEEEEDARIPARQRQTVQNLQKKRQRLQYLQQNVQVLNSRKKLYPSAHLQHQSVSKRYKPMMQLPVSM